MEVRYGRLTPQGGESTIMAAKGEWVMDYGVVSQGRAGTYSTGGNDSQAAQAAQDAQDAQAMRQPQIACAVERTEKLTAEAHDVLSALEERLGPVLHDGDPGIAGELRGTDMVPLAAAMERCNGSVAGLIDRMHRIVDRLEV